MSKTLFAIFDDVPVRNTARTLLYSGALRLDAAYYGEDSQAAYLSLRTSNQRSDRLASIAEVYRSNLRERVFVSSAYGIPLVTGSSLDVEDGENQKYVSRTLTRNVADDILRTGDVLIGAAGTVGKVDLVWKNHEGRLGGEDVLRIRPNPASLKCGYLYAFFSSPIGNALFTHHASGSVIIRVYPEHIADLGIPRLGDSLETEIHMLVTKSFDLRNESKELVNEAVRSAEEANGLQSLPAPSDDRPDSFELSEPALSSSVNERRLEARFYNPSVLAALINLDTCGAVKKSVSRLSHQVIMAGRFKRNYVEADFGTPFLSGKNIIQIRPSDLKYLSSTQTDGLDYLLVKKSWILVTCSGTIGRTCFVWHNFEDYAASQHILRVVPNEAEVDPGYLYSFLSSSYGYQQIVRFRHGSVIDEITDQQLKKVIVPLPDPKRQQDIGDKVRLAYEKRAQALKLEDKARGILMREI
jgi:type I restriction enzyme S subunit